MTAVQDPVVRSTPEQTRTLLVASLATLLMLITFVTPPGWAAGPTTPRATWAGRLYDAENGKEYEGRLTIERPGEMHLRGSLIHFSWLSETVVWTAYEGELGANCEMRESFRCLQRFLMPPAMSPEAGATLRRHCRLIPSTIISTCTIRCS